MKTCRKLIENLQCLRNTPTGEEVGPQVLTERRKPGRRKEGMTKMKKKEKVEAKSPLESLKVHSLKEEKICQEIDPDLVHLRAQIRALENTTILPHQG